MTGRISADRASAGHDGAVVGDCFDMVVWAEVAPDPAALPRLAKPYADAGATWWIETARPAASWWEGVTARVAAGPLGSRSS